MSDDLMASGSVAREPIRGKVARILTARDLVINRGATHGVEVGTEFAVLNRNASDILDPETNKLIGSVPVAKTIVKVVSIQDGMAIARTFRQTQSLTALSNLTIMGGLFAAPRTETLRTDEKTAVEELDEEDSVVKTGDDVVEVFEDNEYLLPPV